MSAAMDPLDSPYLRDFHSTDNVLAYRLSVVETDIKAIDMKLEDWIKNYPTKEVVELMLQPLQHDIKTVRNDVEQFLKERREDETNKKTYSNAFRVALIAAALSPVFAVLVAFIIAGAGTNQ